MFELAAKLSSLRSVWPTDIVRAIIELKAENGWSDEFALLLMGQITDTPEMVRRWVAHMGVSLGIIPKDSVLPLPPREEEVEEEGADSPNPSPTHAVMLVRSDRTANDDPNYR